MTQIYCVKIHQTRLRKKKADNPLHSFDYFPFDRVYLVPTSQQEMAFSLFPHSLITPLSTSLYHALQGLNLEYRRNITIPRSTLLEYEYISYEHQGLGKNITLTPHEWLLVIPTYIVFNKDKTTNRSFPQLAYSLSRIIIDLHNLNTNLPAITLHTPKKNIPAVCAVCKHMSRYYANGCSPGRSICRDSMQLTISLNSLSKNEEV